MNGLINACDTQDLTEVDIKKDDSLSLEGLASQTDIKDSLTKVTKGVYKSVTSVQEAIRKRQRLLDSIPTLTKRELNKYFPHFSTYDKIITLLSCNF